MHKNVEIIFPFTENKEAEILFVAKIFVSLNEMSLEDVPKEIQKFRRGEDIAVLINEKSLSLVEEWMQMKGYFYKVAYR